MKPIKMKSLLKEDANPAAIKQYFADLDRGIQKLQESLKFFKDAENNAGRLDNNHARLVCYNSSAMIHRDIGKIVDFYELIQSELGTP